MIIFRPIGVTSLDNLTPHFAKKKLVVNLYEIDVWGLTKFTAPRSIQWSTRHKTRSNTWNMGRINFYSRATSTVKFLDRCFGGLVNVLPQRFNF